MDKIWTALYKEAQNKIQTKEIPPFIEYGNHACAILSSENNIYSGVSITSTTSINSSAEKSAVTCMFNNGEKTIEKMVIMNELEELIAPSDSCLEFLLELNTNPENVEILLDLEKMKVVKLSELIPDWWGTYRNKK